MKNSRTKDAWWRGLAEALPSRAQIPLLETEPVGSSGQNAEQRGLVVIAARPMSHADGAPYAYIIGGVLLNRSNGFVDYIARAASAAGLMPGLMVLVRPPAVMSEARAEKVRPW